MDDFQALQPGKIKRKNRRSQSESFMQLPEMNQASQSGMPDLTTSIGDDASNFPPSDSQRDSSFDDLLNLSLDAPNPPVAHEDALDSSAALDDERTNSGAWIKNASTPRRSLAQAVIAVDNAEHDAAQTTDATPNEAATKPAETTPTPLSTASPLDLLAASDTASERDDIRKLTPSSRRRQPQQPVVASAPVHDAVETTIQLATKAADKNIELSNKLEISINKIERTHFFNSAACYVLFCVILTLGLYFALSYKLESRNAANALSIQEYKALEKDRNILNAEYQKDQKALTEAYEVYQLVEQGKYEESIDRFVKIRGDLSHPAEIALLEEKIDSVKWRLADNAYHDGIILYRDDNFEQARDAFYKSLTYKENTAYTHLLYYNLAMSLYQLKDYEEARSYFAKAQQGELGSEFDANAKFYRAAAAEKVGDEKEAYIQYDQFLKKYRYHRFADEATKRRTRLEKSKPKD